ncbi:MAG: hypothetical protein WD058_09465 [Dehalococcoidia bacterium]
MIRSNLKTGLGALVAAGALAIPGAAMAADLTVDSEVTVDAAASTTFTVPSATLDAAGYIVVHEGTEAAAGDVIGVSALTDAGAHSDISIDLDRAIEDGEHLWVSVYNETNANATFDGATVDLAVTDAVNGNVDLDGALTFPVLANVSADVEGDGSFSGDIAAVGSSLVLFSGGSLDDLVAAANAEGVLTVVATVDGAFVTHVVGAPVFVNADFAAAFSGGIDADTPLVVVKR